MTESWEEFKILDQPALLNFIFYPRGDYFRIQDSDRIMSFSVPVEEGISISCKFYIGGRQNPNLLFFHGNGEVAGEYADIGEEFNRIGLNLFAADYRGYGSSGGKPTVSNMIKDSHPLLQGFKKILREKGFPGSRFIMGRSLGSASAIELASKYPDEFKGLIIESGFCDVTDLLARIGISLKQTGLKTVVSPGLDRVAKITLPALILHGEYDSIVPLREGEKIYRYIGSKDKRMVVIPDADHNTIFMVGMERYMKELADFVSSYK